MKRNGYKTYLAFFFVLDRLAKILCAKFGLIYFNVFGICIGFFENKGCMFGAFNELTCLIFFRFFFVMILIKRVISSRESKGAIIALVGSFSNLMDVFLFGKVIDYFVIKFLFFGFITFNLADILIIIGSAKMLM